MGLLFIDVGVHQTFIFTATMDKDIRFNVKSKKAPKKSKGTLGNADNRVITIPPHYSPAFLSLL
jgi:hypothetical protein